MTSCRCKEDLVQMKERAAKKMSVHDSDHLHTRVLVHMGTCGLAAGAQKVMDVLREEAAKQDQMSIQIISCGCAGMCSSEPNVTVERKGEPAIMYKHMDADKMRQVFRRHVLAGEVQTDFALAKIQEESHA
ncbi:MAG: (2Fe-2S) ferredoxin domain-containing protein [Desulfovermiculus sp.]|nr:(2Fe-2S) ferredoxin domain-containing protein [Desulfovermiculus sp.]